MKKSLVVLLSAVLTSQAALVYFDISPAGSDVAVGISPANVVPAVTNSTGSGGLISAGVVFDTEAYLLHLAVGYGSAAGFTDLSGPVTQLSINAPAAAGQNAGVLFDLAPYIFPAIDPAKGGVIFGGVVYPTNAVPDLLAGSNYVNLATAANPDGEIRGQLVPLLPTDRPPVIGCPEPATVECGTPVEVTVLVSDPDGDALTVLWTINGNQVQTNAVPASNPPAEVSLSFKGRLPLGTNVVDIAVTDSHTNTVSCSTTVTVVDTTPPVIQRASAKPNLLWPPNHKMVGVKVSAVVTDACSRTTWQIIAVESNEPINGLGDGDTSPDWIITDYRTVKLRAERSGTGEGRIYSIIIQATDAAGNLSEPETVVVNVPKSKGKGKRSR